MFDQGFGPDIRKFLAPLKNRAAKPGDQGFQTVLVTATMTKVLYSSVIPRPLFDLPFQIEQFCPSCRSHYCSIYGYHSLFLIYLISFLHTPSLQAVQKLIDEEFEGIVHLRTSTFQKRVSTARHDFIKLSGSENKLDALMQVMETFISPSLLLT